MASATEVHPSSCPWLEQVTGTHWVGVQFLKYVSAGCGVHPITLRFCEAIHQRGRRRIDLLPEMICCEGAQRAFGWRKGKDEALALKLAERIGVSPNRARELIKQVPVLGHPCDAIRVGDCANPDVLVTYARPDAAMRLARLWETATGHNLCVDVSSIMTVCGNAVVKAHVSQSISVSFGCPDSRQYGGIQPGEMVIAVPAGLINRLAMIANRGSGRYQNDGGSYAYL